MAEQRALAQVEGWVGHNKEREDMKGGTVGCMGSVGRGVEGFVGVRLQCWGLDWVLDVEGRREWRGSQLAYLFPSFAYLVYSQ